MTHLSLRQQHVLTGAIAMLLVVGAVTVGIKGAFGAFDGGYELVGRFDAAGQGLLPGSDVKIRGVNVGEVDSIELAEGEAEVTLRIDDGEDIPEDATATIRPKTLFGEKYVDIDPGPTEETGPYLADGDALVNTLGGFELEAVLTDLYPLLEAVDPVELTTVLGEMAEGGRGLGEVVNRSIVNGEELTTLFADNAELTRRFLTDLAALSEQLDASAGDVIAIADAGNAALPTLVDGEPAVVELLQQAGRLSRDVADLLEANPEFVNAALVEGSRTLQVLSDHEDQVVPLVIGLRQYLQVLAGAIRIDNGDGTLMAAVKALLGGDACAEVSCGPEQPSDAPLPPEVPVAVPDIEAALPPLPGLEVANQATEDLLDAVRRLLG